MPDWPRDAVFYQIFPERFANVLAAIGGKTPQDWLPCGATLQQLGNTLRILLPPRGIAVFGNQAAP